ncbi:hypothetical protein U1Q18_019754 [Sarracenia purpurea var. burkii]
MEVNHILLLTLCWTLVVIGFAGTDDLEVKVNPNTGFDPKSHSTLKNNSNLNGKAGGIKSVTDSNETDIVKHKVQVVGSKEGFQNDKFSEGDSGEDKQVRSKEDEAEKKDKDGSMVKGGDKKEKLNDRSESKEMGKKVTVSLPPVRKEGSHSEECDASNSCKDEKNALVACLRVPGNESPDLSLLIQNKGRGSLSVNIFVPDFVQLESTKIQLQEKEDKKVKVSITNGGTDSLIVLTAGSGNCSLDFRDLTPLNFRKETKYSAKLSFINLKRIPLIAFLVFAGLLITALAWICVGFQKRRRQFNSNGSKYQKLDTELPVSGGNKGDSDLNEGWDDNWDDNWDDEEAPKTPSMPVTPSLSSKGLASRRFNKEGWKD